MKYLISYTATVLVAFIGMSEGKAQSPAPTDSLLTTAHRQASHNYQQYIGTAAPLYNGPMYRVYEHLMDKGQPYFLAPGFYRGDVMYDNILYQNIPLKYDVVTNSLVTMVNQLQVVLINDQIAWFNIDKHHFVKLGSDQNVAPGYYQELFKNERIALYRKEKKGIYDDLYSGSTVRKYIDSSSNHLVFYNNTVRTVNTKSQLLAAFSDKKAQIRQFLRKNDFKLNKSSRDEELVQTITYYDSLIK